MKKIEKKALRLSFLLCILLILLTFAPQLKAMAVMTIWDRIQYKDSLLADSGIRISIPGGTKTAKRDWFPFVMNFNADQSFASYMGDPNLRLTVLYNFGAFSLSDACSSLYDPDSPYYNSFYGAYLVRNTNTNASTSIGPQSNTQTKATTKSQASTQIPFGFQTNADGSLSIKPEEISIVPAFDYKVLVLHDFGLAYDDFQFDWDITKLEENVSYAGHDGWTAAQATLKVSGAVHKAQPGVFSYLQYGRPSDYPYDDFAPAAMTGQIYARYFPEYDVSLFLYIVGADPEIVKKCDQEILSQTKIN